MPVETQTATRAAASGKKSDTRWVEFITSQSGFRMITGPDGTQMRGALFTHHKGDKVEKPADEAARLIEAGTCRPCVPPADVV